MAVSSYSLRVSIACSRCCSHTGTHPYNNVNSQDNITLVGGLTFQAEFLQRKRRCGGARDTTLNDENLGNISSTRPTYETFPHHRNMARCWLSLSLLSSKSAWRLVWEGACYLACVYSLARWCRHAGEVWACWFYAVFCLRCVGHEAKTSRSKREGFVAQVDRPQRKHSPPPSVVVHCRADEGSSSPLSLIYLW